MDIYFYNTLTRQKEKHISSDIVKVANFFNIITTSYLLFLSKSTATKITAPLTIIW